jgi:hypothetical protein
MATLKAATKPTNDPKSWEVIANLPPMRPFVNSKATPIEISCPQLVYGVELEMENAGYFPEWEGPGYSFHEDNSLRNNGIELVTQPCNLTVLNWVLHNFWNKSGINESNHSERTSVHVHVNCRDMSVEQIASVLLLYQLFEFILFHWIGNERDKNIFCVPWAHTMMNYNVINNMARSDHAVLKRWMKYTALNLLPLYKYGTVEFRHMAGTSDLNKIINWCNIIGCLFTYAKNNKLSDIKTWIMDLNTTSAYRNTLETVFKSWSDGLKVTGYESLLEEGVLNMKFALMGDIAPVGKNKDSQYEEAPTWWTTDPVFTERDILAPRAVQRGTMEAGRFGRAEAVLAILDSIDEGNH